ncbi:hypothetical protein FVE85_3594 [Porphyridium purpureum]|uniref:Uncharacterized protein n=1 Tax=Porphyridium purpureum TaxID=35688 RepID=A0A5J4YL57_PORPP|nr:hypothetical protein FVE85_3594 [Porphyridium purpureum]|eukprot:POR7161..scf249_10
MLKGCIGYEIFRRIRVSREVFDAPRWIHASAAALKKKRFCKARAGGLKPDNRHEGTFYAIRVGRDLFRGIVLRHDDYVNLMRGAMSAKGQSFRLAFDKAKEYCMSGRGGGAQRFYAFRYGLHGARGIAVRKPDFQHATKRANSPALQKEVFATATQAIVYCEQAGTPLTDSKDLRASLRFLTQNRNLRVSSLWSRYLIHGDMKGLSPSGPLYHPESPIAETERPRVVAESAALSPAALPAESTTDTGIGAATVGDPIKVLAHETSAVARALDREALDDAVRISQSLLSFVEKLHKQVLDARNVKERAERHRKTLAEMELMAKERSRSILEATGNVETARNAERIEAYIQGEALPRDMKGFTAVAMLHSVLHFSERDTKPPIGVDASRLFVSSEAASIARNFSIAGSTDTAKKTGDRVELEALLLALNYFILRYLDTGEESVKRIVLKTRSRYCLSRCNTYLPKWRAKGWRMSYKVKHQDLWEVFDTRLLILRSVCDVSFELGAFDEHAFHHSPTVGGGADFATRSLWSSTYRQSLSEVLVDGSFRLSRMGRDKARIGVYFGSDSSCNVAAVWPISLVKPRTSMQVEVLAAICGLDQILRYTLAGSRSVLPSTEEVVLYTDFNTTPKLIAQLDALWADDLETNPGHLWKWTMGLSGGQNGLYHSQNELENHARGLGERPGRTAPLFDLLTPLYLRVLLVRCLRWLQVMWVPRESNKHAHKLAGIASELTYNQQNQRVVDVVGAQIQNSRRIELDRNIIASLHCHPRLAEMVAPMPGVAQELENADVTAESTDDDDEDPNAGSDGSATDQDFWVAPKEPEPVLTDSDMDTDAVNEEREPSNSTIDPDFLMKDTWQARTGSDIEMDDSDLDSDRDDHMYYFEHAFDSD